MISKNIVCVLFISLVLASSIGCLAKNTADTPASPPAIPRENLPQGFRLMAALPEMDSRVNMTGYIEDFDGEKDIGPANVSVGIYKWADPTPYDAKITLIQLTDEEKAENAISNFKSQYDDMVARGLPIFGNATVNDHEVLEIRDPRGDNSIRHLFLWKTNSLVTLVEGTQDRNQSLELAEITGL